jgi:hypothetical protein
MTRSDRFAAAALALLLAVLLELARGHADWGPSEGVYALTSRLLLHGGDLYGGLIASQPPWTYLFGAGALGVHDSLDTLRLACGLLQVLTGLLAAEAVWRLTAEPVRGDRGGGAGAGHAVGDASTRTAAARAAGRAPAAGSGDAGGASGDRARRRRPRGGAPCSQSCRSPCRRRC